MNETIVIGKKMKRWDIIKSLIVISFMPLFILIILAAMIFPVLNISENIKIIIVIFDFLISWMILIPMIGATQRLEISSNYVSYYHIDGVWKQFKEVLRILFGKKEHYHFNLPVDKIKSISLSYRIVLGAYGRFGYTIMLGFVMKDNTIVKFTPFDISGGGNHNIEYLQALELLEHLGVKINDKYGLREVLSLSDQEIMKYLEHMEGNKI